MKILFLLLLLAAGRSIALYEDQAGKFDWYQQYIGRIDRFYIERQTAPGRRIIATTDSNVYAAINLVNGNIEWRHHMREDEKALSVDYCKNHLITLTTLPDAALLRVWDTVIGTLLWEKQIAERAAIRSVIRCDEDSDTIYVGYDVQLLALKLKTGVDKWTAELPINKDIKRIDLIVRKSSDSVLVIAEKIDRQFMLKEINNAGVELQNAQEFPSLPLLPSANLQCDASSASQLFICLDRSNGELHVLNANTRHSFVTKIDIPTDFTTSVANSIDLRIISMDKFLISYQTSLTTDADNGRSLTVFDISTLNDGGHPTVSNIFSVANFKLFSIAEQDGQLFLSTVQFVRSSQKTRNIVKVHFTDLKDGREMKQLSSEFSLAVHHGHPVKMEPVLFRKKDNAIAYRLFLITSDNARHFMNNNGNVLWMREESLADVVAVDMLDLPVSDTEAKMDEEFGHNKDNIAQKFFKRISTQLSQLKYFIQEQIKQSRTPRHNPSDNNKYCQRKDDWTCTSSTTSNTDGDDTQSSNPSNFPESQSSSNDNYNNTDSSFSNNPATALRRDSFNVHKMLVLATTSGKLFGLQSSTGDIVWRHLIEGARPFPGNKVQLFILRTTAHFPHPPEATLLMQHIDTGRPLLFTFNPITGSQQGAVQLLSYDMFQATLLPLPATEDNAYSKPVLVLDRRLKVHIFPATFKLTLSTHPIFIYRVDDDTGIVYGYEIQRRRTEPDCQSTESPDHDCYVADEIWKMDFSGQGQRIAAIAFKSPIEQVHSVGKILSDRNVLYKYLNPNLLALMTESLPTNASPTTSTSQNQEAAVTLYLIDVVTGKIVYSTVHKKATGPLSLVQSENWVVYAFQNARSHRTEMAVLELYEPYEIPDSIISEIKDVDTVQLRRSMNVNRNDVGGGFDIVSILGGERATTKKFSSRQRNRIMSTEENIYSNPVVLKQGYIIGTFIRRAAVSITEKGITSKSLLLALETGAVLELPKAQLDPRRSLSMTQELLEEGVEPYMPEIMIKPFSLINYNHTVARARSVFSGPSGLESTSLVFVHGLDLFFTQVAPSKMYDVLKEDFDYLFIATVTIGMIFGAFVTQKLAARRALYRAWQ